MADFSGYHIDSLLLEAEKRLQGGTEQRTAEAPRAATEIVPAVTEPPPKPSASADSLGLRVPQQKQQLSQKAKDTAGSDWFNLPKTNLTPELKRDWQLLRMRNLLDPKNQKKALRSSVPQYSHVGEIIAGPTEFHSARLTRKERKGTLLEEVMSNHNHSKLRSKYAGIQREKTSGKKASYQKLLAQRRKRAS
ncbi:Fcf2 pre-rRNA processing-domain-containing protein [Stachybotrys elegans]|uniref:Fcf2 pre-rRNA processing-domain-containing protein n=1 Tax=Stachybotrys elegans TaxID=80388 RepID=A0A8K0WMR9_9HYPO|nr:Fcf2 pre-rRNA processing-domain-containing protein [Stachybotrys elegans]